MKDLPFSLPITEFQDFYLNGNEVMEIISPAAADFWPRLSNQETLIHDSTGHTLYSISTITVSVGPGRNDWKQVITHVYDNACRLIYSTDVKQYLDASAEASKRRRK